VTSPAPQRFQRDLRLQSGVNPPRLVFFVIVRSVYQTEPPFSNLTSGPKKRGPLHFAAMPNSVNMLFPFRAERRDGATFEMCAAGAAAALVRGEKLGAMTREPKGRSARVQMGRRSVLAG
jgi:hypothetical protein